MGILSYLILYFILSYLLSYIILSLILSFIINYYKTNHVYHYSTSLISSCYCIILHHGIAPCNNKTGSNRFKTGSFRIICQSFNTKSSSTNLQNQPLVSSIKLINQKNKYGIYKLE